ncbi:hypothetical protein EYF80_023655 [Liparis tanakae]|uniref:Uncharacterized protein n=1 Tax=Liparis tanakae TaxID=230148 RepID=A0A4Z2HK77_9TELE|nr:hypothetical protein EYF80_023655 [Liparis tanakae]
MLPPSGPRGVLHPAGIEREECDEDVYNNGCEDQTSFPMSEEGLQQSCFSSSTFSESSVWPEL